MLTKDEAQKYLDVPDYMFAGLVHSGLLGYTTTHKGQISFYKEALDQYEKYGTQWNKRERHLESLITSYHDSSAPSQYLHARINSQSHHKPEDDIAWMVQLYLRPNFFFFPDLNRVTTIGGGVAIDIAQRGKLTIHGHPDLQVRFYPDPDAKLGLITTFCTKIPSNSETNIDTVIEAIHPFLSNLAFAIDRPLNICQEIHIGIPSGSITSRVIARPKSASISDCQLPLYDQPQCLKTAKSLYMTGLNATEPMSQFLSFFKVKEELCKISQSINKKTRKKPEPIPNHSAYHPHQGKSLFETAQALNDTRSMIAHGSGALSAWKVPVTELDRKEYKKLYPQIPIVKYIARSYIDFVTDHWESNKDCELFS